MTGKADTKHRKEEFLAAEEAHEAIFCPFQTLRERPCKSSNKWAFKPSKYVETSGICLL